MTWYSFAGLVVLHLWPGAIFTAFIVLAISVGIEPAFALFAGIGLVLVPLELGYLALFARRATGSWSPLQAVDYKRPLPKRQVALAAGLLSGWFLIMLMLSILFVDAWLSETVFFWMPEGLRQFATVDEQEGDPTTSTELVALLLMALLFNGIAGPATEELYFRGHLLPRLEAYGSWAPIINTLLFAIYHFFSPWRYPAIIVGFLPISWAAWRTRSIFVALSSHIAINMTSALLLLAAFLSARG